MGAHLPGVVVCAVADPIKPGIWGAVTRPALICSGLKPKLSFPVPNTRDVGCFCSSAGGVHGFAVRAWSRAVPQLVLTTVLLLGLGADHGMLCEDAQGGEVATGMLMVAASVSAAKAW